jgi:putative phage-type endonuclease
MDRKEWLEARRSVITATDIGAIAGVSKWRSALDVFNDKMGIGPEVEENEAMRWGKALEPVVADRYAAENKVRLIDGVFVKRDWMGGTPDRIIIGEDGANRYGLEIKTGSLWTAKEWGDEGTDHVPDSYLLQCAWYMALTELSRWDVAVLLGGQDFRTYTVRRDMALEKRLIEIAAEFRERHILTGTPPEIDGSRAASEYIKQVFNKQKKDDLVAATPEQSDIAEKLIEAKAKLATIEEEISLCENKLKAAIGDASGMVGNGWKVSWKAGKDTEKVDWKSAASANVSREVLVKYTTVSPGARRFLLTVNKQ